jgi:hypothetical protein
LPGETERQTDRAGRAVLFSSTQARRVFAGRVCGDGVDGHESHEKAQKGEEDRGVKPRRRREGKDRTRRDLLTANFAKGRTQKARVAPRSHRGTEFRTEEPLCLTTDYTDGYG